MRCPTNNLNWFTLSIIAAWVLGTIALRRGEAISLVMATHCVYLITIAPTGYLLLSGY
jgi:hypothetical protein